MDGAVYGRCMYGVTMDGVCMEAPNVSNVWTARAVNESCTLVIFAPSSESVDGC